MHNIYLLNGEWIFCPDKLSFSSEYNSVKLSVPTPWNRYPNNKALSNSIKYGTYHMHIKLPDSGSYSMVTTFISSAHQLYINGELYGSSGKVSSNSKDEYSNWKTQLINFQTDTSEIDIDIVVSNFTCQKSGIVNNIYFGSSDSLSHFYTLQILKVCIICGLFLGIGFFLLILSYCTKRKTACISLSFYCFATLLLYLIIYFGVLPTAISNMHTTTTIKLEFIAYCIQLICIYRFVNSIYSKDESFKISLFIRIFNILYLLFTVFCPGRYASLAGNVYITAIFINIPYIIFVLLKALQLKRQHALISLIGIVILISGSIHDIICSYTTYSINNYLVPNTYIVAAMIFTLCQINSLILDIYQSYNDSLSKNQMEIAFLQAQISPHFIFNSLNNVRCLMDTDITAAKKLLLDFCDFLRIKHKFDFRNDNLYTLSEEIDFLKSYTDIQNVRLNNMINLIIEIKTEDMKYLIPPLIIQPLIENSIVHGFNSKPLTITVSITSDKNYLYFTISDNGKGMNIKLINSPNMTESHSGIGVNNIKYRLSKLYGQTLTIESTLNIGTTICFKMQKEESKHELCSY